MHKRVVSHAALHTEGSNVSSDSRNSPKVNRKFKMHESGANSQKARINI